MAKQKKAPSKTHGKKSGSFKLSLERTGGFSGIRLLTVLDAESLSSDERAELLDLIEESDFFGLPPRIPAKKPSPDRFQYKLKIIHGRRNHAIRVAEEETPPALHSLIQRIMSRKSH